MSTAVPARSLPASAPLELLFEEPGLPAFELPGELAAAYGGELGFAPPRLYASFATSLDGVAAIPGERQPSHLHAPDSEADRFVLGLLRACADAILIGAGTLRGSPRMRWTAAHAYPAAGAAYARLRRLRGRPPQPTLAVLGGSGGIEPRHPGLGERALVLTSEQAAAKLEARFPGSATIVPIGDQAPLDPARAIEVLRLGGHELILCEGGPTLLGALASAGLVDELFLTLSPLLAGQPTGRRGSLLEGAEQAPGRPLCGRLLSLRQAGSHLFLRYQLPRAGAAAP